MNVTGQKVSGLDDRVRHPVRQASSHLLHEVMELSVSFRQNSSVSSLRLFLSSHFRTSCLRGAEHRRWTAKTTGCPDLIVCLSVFTGSLRKQYDCRYHKDYPDGENRRKMLFREGDTDDRRRDRFGAGAAPQLSTPAQLLKSERVEEVRRYSAGTGDEEHMDERPG